MEYIKSSDVPFESLKGYECEVKVVYVVDGDTVHLIFREPLKFHYKKVIARLAGINTPELNAEPEQAKRARNVLTTYVTNSYIIEDDMRSSKELIPIFDTNTRLIYAKFLGKDKYSRELVELFTYDNLNLSTISINQRMIDSQYAKPY